VVVVRRDERDCLASIAKRTALNGERCDATPLEANFDVRKPPITCSKLALDCEIVPRSHFNTALSTSITILGSYRTGAWGLRSCHLPPGSSNHEESPGQGLPLLWLQIPRSARTRI